MEDHRNKYEAVIIGFGKGGKTLAATLGAAGKKTALIEQSAQMYGGTCINVGCIPTKYLVEKAKQASIRGGDFSRRAEAYREAIAKKAALTGKLRAKNFEKVNNMPNVTVITGRAKLIAPHRIEVAVGSNTEYLEAEQIFLNTGSVPVMPSIPGLQENAYVYTSQDLLSLETLPQALVIIGGGYIGMEFASIYADFGSRVTVIQHGSRFLPREDAEIADMVRKNLEARGVTVMTDVQTERIAQADGRAVVSVKEGKYTHHLEADAVLVATGRRPNTDGLGLEIAGVAVNDRGGIVVDDSLRTTAPHIYAMGDVVGGLQFTYISLDDFRIVRSALLGDGSDTLKTRGAVPYSVFLNPPFSRVGMSEQEAREKGYRVKVAKLSAAAIPKALVTEQPSGLLKAVIDADTGLILGAHLFCEASHEIINLVKLAMDAKLSYTVLRDMVYTHPTMSEALNDLFDV